MNDLTFNERLDAQADANKQLCIGLDCELAKIPLCVTRSRGVQMALTSFANRIVDATHDIVACYKPNIAFFEAHGADGLNALREIVAHINAIAPNVPVILDAKRADIDNTNLGYLVSAFDWLGCDAITVHPYLGEQALKPFLNRADKGVIVLCRTSNKGSDEFQDLIVNNGDPLYTYVARRVATQWNQNKNCSLVVGATFPAELHRVRDLVGDMPILIPGIGAQGGDLEKTVLAGRDKRGRGMMINASRSIIFASSGADFAEAAWNEALRLDGEINRIRMTGI